MMKGPAPTGSCANAFSPILLNEFSEMIQFGIESNIWLMKAASGKVRLTWIWVGESTLMTLAAGADVLTFGLVRGTAVAFGLGRATAHSAAQVHDHSRSRVQFQATPSGVSGEPSEGSTPGRR